MEKTDQDYRYSTKEADQRLRKILRGAFSGPPTPLKDIPVSQGRRKGKPRKAAVRPASP